MFSNTTGESPNVPQMYPGFTQYNKPANLTSRSGPLCAGHGEGCSRWNCSSSRKRPINDLLTWNALMSAPHFQCRWGCDKRLNLIFLVGVRTVSWNQVLAIFTETVSEGLHNWWPQWGLNPINDLASPSGFGRSSLIMVCCRFAKMVCPGGSRLPGKSCQTSNVWPGYSNVYRDKLIFNQGGILNRALAD